MSTANMDPDLLATLTDEERAAIEESEHTPEELAAMKAIADEGGNDDPDDDEDDDEGEDDSADDGKGKQADAAAATSEQEAGSEKDTDQPAAESADNFRPKYQASMPEGYEAKINDLTQESLALAQQFKDGEIDFDVYTAKVSELNTKRDELNRAATKAEIASEMNAQSAEQEWSHTVTQFAAQVKREIDYTKDVEKQQDMDLFVKSLASNPANAEKSMRWFLEEAHRRVKALHGIKSTAQASDGADKDPVKQAAKDRKSPVDSAPKNLSQVPGSEGPGDLAGEFAHMDNMDGMELEMALAKMSPDQRDRYARGT